MSAIAKDDDEERGDVHIRNERATRERFGYVGKELPTPAVECIAFCGADASSTFFFLGADHAALSSLHGTPLQDGTPCPACIDVVVDALLDLTEED